MTQPVQQIQGQPQPAVISNAGSANIGNAQATTVQRVRSISHRITIQCLWGEGRGFGGVIFLESPDTATVQDIRIAAEKILPNIIPKDALLIINGRKYDENTPLSQVEDFEKVIFRKQGH